MTIAKAIAALERASEQCIVGPVAEAVDDALAELRSLPGPATEEELNLLIRVEDLCPCGCVQVGFRAAERRIFGEGE